MRKRTRRTALDDGARDASFSSSLSRGLAILRAFTVNDTTLGNQDLIERTGLPKATVSRLSYTLVGLGYLHYDQALGRYSIGPAAVSLGYSALSSSAVIRTARPLMQELADSTGAAVALGTRDGDEMVYLANCRSLSPVSLRLNVGSRLPIWRTAMGLAYLVEMPLADRDALIDRILAAEPAEADRIRKAVADAFACRRKHGFVCVQGLWYSYINAVGVAFQPTDGTPAVAITCGGIVDIVPGEACMRSVGPALVALKNRLEARLNGRPEPAPAPVRRRKAAK